MSALQMSSKIAELSYKYYQPSGENLVEKFVSLGELGVLSPEGVRGSVLVSGRATQLCHPERKSGREKHGLGRGGS